MGKIVGEPYVALNRKNEKNGIYSMYYTDSIEGSKELSLRTKDYHEAVQKMAVIMERNRGRSKKVTIDIEEQPIIPLLDRYLKKREGSVADYGRIKSCVDMLKKFCKSHVVADIDLDFCADFIDWRTFSSNESKTIKASTTKKDLKCLRVALNSTLPESQSQDIEIYYPEVEIAEIEVLKCHEAMQLFRAACKLKRSDELLKKFLILGFKTGRRKKSILKLEWDRVFLDKGYIIWHPPGQKKTKKVNPVGTIPNGLIKHLRKWRKDNPTDKFVISRNGQPIKDIKKSFRTAVDLAQILDPETNEPRRIYPHMMRHSCATWLMESGMGIEMACSYLGMTPEVLREHYWKHHPDFQKGPKELF